MKCRDSLINSSTKILKILVISLIKLKKIISLRILIIKKYFEGFNSSLFYIKSHKIVQNYLE